MLIAEARWLGERLAAVPGDDLFPLLNVGSSTAEFREAMQPHIHEEVFEPLQRRGGRICHVDIKAAPGVDLVGNLLDPGFLARLRKVEIKSALVSNLLEHVPDRQLIADALLEIVPRDGYIVVSGPHAFPYHADPLDTMFRPSVADVTRHFPGTSIVDSAIIDAGNWRCWKATERGGRSLPRVLARLCVPFYRPGDWMALARQTPFLLRHSKAFAVVLRKL